MREERAISLDLRVADLAAKQHGVVSLAQLTRFGLSDSSISRRVGSGRLHRMHRGVYAVGHRVVSDEGRWMAAVLALSGRATLSHESAAALWRILPPLSQSAVHVTVPGHSGRRKRSGITIHRSLELPESDRTLRLSIPVTSPTRTLVDLRQTLEPHALARARRQAEFLGLRIELERLDDDDGTRSELERRFLALCRRHRIPEPHVNARIASFLVDFHWAGTRVIVETDGYAAHRGRAAFEADRRRDAALRAAGYEVLRFSWKQVTEEPGTVARAVRRALGAT